MTGILGRVPACFFLRRFYLCVDLSLGRLYYPRLAKYGLADRIGETLLSRWNCSAITAHDDHCDRHFCSWATCKKPIYQFGIFPGVLPWSDPGRGGGQPGFFPMTTAVYAWLLRPYANLHHPGLNFSRPCLLQYLKKNRFIIRPPFRFLTGRARSAEEGPTISFDLGPRLGFLFIVRGLTKAVLGRSICPSPGGLRKTA